MHVRFGAARILAGACGTLVLAAGVLAAWTHRFEISSDDAISYLDLADAWRRGDLASAVNGHWAPFYSWLLAAALSLADPARQWDYALLKIVNLAGLAAALMAFAALARQCAQVIRRADPDSCAPAWCWTLCAYGLFAWAGLLAIGVACDTPDMWGMAFMLGAEAALLHMLTGGLRPTQAAVFGVLLGAAYLARYAMMPVGLVCFAVLGFAAWKKREGLSAPLVAAATFAIVAGSYVVLLSAHYHHFTISESGKLSYALTVNPPRDVIPSTLWRGGPEGFGTPVHPPRLLRADPAVYEFAAPIGGTYAPWLDPAYWMEGVQVRFDPARQATVLLENLWFIVRSFLAVLLAGIAALSFAGRATWKGFPAALPLLLPGAAGIGLYALMSHLPDADLPFQPSMRYLAPFVVMLALGMAVSLRPKRATPRLWVILALATAGFVVLQVGLQVREGFRSTQALQGRKPYAEVADAVRRMGVRPGDRVAILGDEPFHEGWARLARVRIVAQLRDTGPLWSLPQEKRARVFEQIAGTGARVIVGALNERPPGGARESGWRRVDAGPWACVYAFSLPTPSLPSPTP